MSNDHVHPASDVIELGAASSMTRGFQGEGNDGLTERKAGMGLTED